MVLNTGETKAWVCEFIVDINRGPIGHCMWPKLGVLGSNPVWCEIVWFYAGIYSICPCDQMARLFALYLAIYSNKKLPNSV